MRKIGLIGGMSFESSAVYYRRLNEIVRERLGGLHSAEVILYSVNFEVIVALQTAGRWDEAGAVLAGAARSLERAGAECILICTNTMHLVAGAVQGASAASLIHILDETAVALQNAGRKRPLLLATKYTMEEGFYQARMKTHGLEIIVPEPGDRGVVHGIIFEELCSGHVHDGSREQLTAMIERAKSVGADSVILGCTEICMILDPEQLPLPGFDSTEIHVRAAVRFSLENN